MNNIPTQSKTLLHQPLSIYRLAHLQMWERFAYYGLRALLLVYLMQHLGSSSPEVYRYFGVFAGLALTLPFPAGLICKRFLNSKESIVLGTGLTSLGLFMLVHSTLWGLALGLAGTAIFRVASTACIGEFSGDGGRPAAFALSQLYINLGAALGTLLTASFAEKWGWELAFPLAAVLLLCGLAGLSERRWFVIPAALAQLGLVSYFLWQRNDFFITNGILPVIFFGLSFLFWMACASSSDDGYEMSITPNKLVAPLVMVLVTVAVLKVALIERFEPFVLAGLVVLSALWLVAYLARNKSNIALQRFCLASLGVFAVFVLVQSMSERITEGYDFALGTGRYWLLVIAPMVAWLLWSLFRSSTWITNLGATLLFVVAGFCCFKAGDHFSGWSGWIDSSWLLWGGGAVMIAETVFWPASQAALTKHVPKEDVGAVLGAWLATLTGVVHLCTMIIA